MHPNLKQVKEQVYDKCKLSFIDLKIDAESTEYGACSFVLNGKQIVHRVSKITPTKVGQFVTIWKRNEAGITAPFDHTDPLDFIVITSSNHDQIGQFVFPKSVLAAKGIITKDGKRGIRVYPPWDAPTSDQAKRTQRWQVQFFCTITPESNTHLDWFKTMFNA
jgi:hypothetical protein